MILPHYPRPPRRPLLVRLWHGFVGCACMALVWALLVYAGTNGGQG